jgi:type IV pilus assembly protein PilY1
VGHTVTIDYTTNDGTAEDENGSNDYTLTSGILTFNPADMSHTIAVPITDDVLVEFEEIFVVDLSNSLPMEITNIVDPQGECNILIDELYEIAILDTSVGEGDGNATFTMTVNPAIQAGDSVGISYTTMDGSAEDQNGSNDYTLTTGTLFFNPGDTLRTVDVPITNDPIVDPSESFDMLIGLNFPPAITTITDDKATCPIVDNDLYLEISKTGSGDGDLAAGNGVPSGMTGGTAPPIGLPMTFVYEVGDTVSLDATPYPNPYPGSVFGGWSGDHTDASANTTITMDTHKQVTADFIQQYYIAPIISTMGSISPAGVAPPVPDPTISGHVIVLHGANQPFSITPAALDWNVVTDVLEDGTSVGASAVPAVPVIGGNSYTFMNVTANHTIGANYDDHGGVCPGSYTTLDPAGNDPQIEVVNGDLSSGGDQDMFKVVLPSRGIITIYTEGNTDTYGHLLDSGCTTLSENDERSQIDSNFFIQESMDAGTYFIRVRHYFSTTGTGAYRLYVKFDPDDHGSNCNTATTVDRNSTTAGVIVTGGDEDYFKVVMPAQGIITTYTTGTTDTFGLFLDSNCNVITQNENSGDGDNFRIVRDVGPGTYHVEVRHSDIIAGTGTYNLVVESVLTHIIAASSGYGGTISPSGGVSVPEGGSQSFDILSSGVNAILKLEVDGTEIGAAVGNTSYTYGFTNVTTNHTIHVTFDLPQDACLDISDTPLDARYRAAPANIMFVMDDSGSMDWTFMTDDGDGLFRTDGNTYRYVFDDAGDNARDGWILPRGNRRMHWQSQWYEYNRIYYNPNVDYQPWPTLDNADPDNPRSHPYHENPTFDLELLYDTINTGAGAGIIVDNEDAEFTKTPDTVDIIINDRDPEFSKTASSGGEWRNANSDEAYNGEHYFTRRNGNYTAKWTPNLTAGDYKVYARWRDRDSYSTNVPYTINHAGGSDTVYVNQEINGGKWYELGTYTFNAGTGGNVEMIFTRTSSNASACADAVRFVPMSNAWDWSTSTQAQQDNYFYTPSAGTYTATWTPNIDLAGSYEVSARWVSDPNRSTAVPYTINHAGGSDTVNVDQRQNGGQWVVLGTYNFNAGTGGNVTIDNFTVNDPDTERIVADSVRIVPGGIPATIRIYRSHYYVWSETNSKPYLVNIGLNQIRYFEFTDDGDDVIEVGELLPVGNPNDVPDDVRTDRTYLEERQNFANWYSFYRRRELTATAAIANVIVSMQGVNIGFASINDRLIQPVLPVNVGTDDSTDTLLDRLYGYVLLSASTPLRQGLQAVGQYFHADDGQTGGIGASPYETAENGGECQQAFAIVMTDGYWNGGSPNVGNTDKDEAGDPDNSIYDGPPYEDNWSNTLADVAMHYYETDLSPNDLTMDDGNPGLNDLVPTNKLDEASFQHMATYTVSFGVFGTLNPADYDLESSDSADWPTWPDPFNGSDQRNIDDLWHAAVNGRGTFSSAANPVELLDALLSIMQNIEARIGSASSVSINGDELYDEVSSDIRMFQASYNSDGWTGDVKAHQVDLETGSVEVDSYIWSAAAKLEDITPTARIIATYDGSQGIPFRYDDPGMTTELKDMLDASDATNAERMLNYLRGDTTYEEKNGGTFRNRIQKLGDIVHSSPTHKNGYLYAGGNDGMLHVFDATDGKEVFAYVPKLVFENLKNLSDPLYTHQYFVDLSPAAKAVNFSGTNKTILVGGLGKGGRGYYALDITDPSNITTETALAGKVMWEYPNASTAQSEIDDVGYSFSKAAIVNSKAGWVVIVGNGYNSVSGKAKLLILDAETGTLLKSIDTGVGDCNGLSIPVPIDVNYDDKVDYVYAGDLKGNMWKFDLTVPGPSEPGYDAAFDPEDYFDVAYKAGDPLDNNKYTYSGLQKIGVTPMPLFQAKSLAGPQPITAKPDVMVHPDNIGYMVVFGTGKYFGESDIADTSTQTIYGIWDYGDDVDDSEYLGSFERASTPLLSNQPNYDVDLLKQDDIDCDPLVTTCDGDLFVVGPSTLRVTTQYAADWGVTSKDAADDCLEGIGVDECDPDGYGANPNPVNNAGWYYDLPITGERVVTDTLLRDGKAIVIAYTPEQTPCGSGGSSIIMEMNAGTGARLLKPQFDINEDGKIDSNDLVNIGTVDDPIYVAPTGLKSEGRLYPPAILRIDEDKEKKYFSSSRGKIVEMTEKAAKLGLSYWIEYE